MQAPGGPDEDRSGGFEYGGWTVPFADESMMRFVISTDVAEEIARLKERTEGGGLQIHGSGALARSLMTHDLIDEYNLLRSPVVLGRGGRLFPEGGLPAAFERIGARETPSSVSTHTYRPAGRARFGSFDV
ncbi:dihydrofolate reductase family protein [Streptomyces sp. NPDC059832]|uniref:dihydrofolate reductase family protein n=1 Tax=unclassified Streptomyces TaxID=2593676 RepID=UPI00364F4836